MEDFTLDLHGSFNIGRQMYYHSSLTLSVEFEEAGKFKYKAFLSQNQGKKKHSKRGKKEPDPLSR